VCKSIVVCESIGSRFVCERSPEQRVDSHGERELIRDNQDLGGMAYL
jgi:hypothetical protein